MQRDVESQIKGVEAQVRGQGEAMMKVLHSLKKKGKESKEEEEEEESEEEESCSRRGRWKCRFGKQQ